MSEKPPPLGTGASWPSSVLWCLAMLSAITVIVLFLRLWVLMAVPIGFLFGFFLQKGDLCGAAALSEILLFRSRQKLAGFWVCIVVCMAGFAVLDLLGWVVLAPKPLLWVNMVAGGIIFGAGIVLAGGCVTGSLYKAGTGNLNSMAAILGIPIGVSMVSYGYLNPLHAALSKHVIQSDAGGVVTLSTLTGLSYQVLALLLAGATLAGAFVIARRKKNTRALPVAAQGKKKQLLTRSWKPWQAGIAIGILAVPAYLCAAASGHNYPLGTTGGITHSILTLTDKNVNFIYKTAEQEGAETSSSRSSHAGKGEAPPEGAGRRPVVCWLPILCLSLVAGSWFAGRLSGQARLLKKPPEQVIIAFFGGILVGAGALFGEGCFYGNIVSGWALMSVGALLFGMVVVPASLITTYFYLIGGKLVRRK